MRGRSTFTRAARWLAAASAPLALVGAGISTASAATPRPAWSVRSVAMPTNFAPGDDTGADVYKVLVTNVGSMPTDGSMVSVTDTLPPGVSVEGVSGLDWTAESAMSCTATPVQCTYSGVVPAGDVLEMDVTVGTEASVSGHLANAVSVGGGGAAEKEAVMENPVGTAMAPFALEGDFEFRPAGVDGEAETRAGAHPYSLTTTLDYTTQATPGEPGVHVPAENPKDVVIDFPLGLVGNPSAVPECPLSKLNAAESGLLAECPPDTKIGEVTLGEPGGFVSSRFTQFTGNNVTPLYNLVPEEGHLAEFGFLYSGIIAAHLYPSVVRTDAGYVLRVSVPNTPSQFLVGGPGYVTGFSLELFGDPAKRDLTGGEAPFFTNPADCSASAQSITVHVDTWTRQGRVDADGTPDFSDPNWLAAKSALPPVRGCNALRFKPRIGLRPSTTQGASPAGVTVEVEVPQAPSDDAVLATPALEDATVGLPAGISINPAGADGLGACSLAQVGIGSDGVPDNSRPECPDASKIGTVEVATSLLEAPVGGSVYLAEQEANPFKSLIAVYVVIDDRASGLLVKLAGEVVADPVTGALTASFKDAPQLPFSKLVLRLKGGQRALLSTPEACGIYATTSSLTPWSAPESGPPATPSDAFQIGSGAGGGPCAAAGFAPALVAGTLANQAGGFSPLTVAVSRKDGEQTLGSIAATLPPGLAAMLAKVERCGDLQAAAGTCPAASQIGHVNVQAGVGGQPIALPEAGRAEDPVYLTGPYEGAPFGMAIVVHPQAGPFDLQEDGRPVVVRARIEVNPHTARVVVSSDSLPTILRGVPLTLRTVVVTIDREGFTFNPTSCRVMSVDGVVSSSVGARAYVGSRFQAANCANLPFKPSFSVSTRAGHSKDEGAYLHVAVSSREKNANVGTVKVALPRQLPSRLSTLKLACLQKVFEVNPAACPPGSLVGSATARTPLLRAPLAGPAYFVSHGGAKFPELVMVMQGEGVTLDLAGETFISPAGITSSTFRGLPDVPISRFDLVLPVGAHSALGGNGNFCTAAMHMPTTLEAESGAVIKQNTKIAVSGCKPAVTVVRHRVKGATARIAVRVPAAGRLTAAGRGLSGSTKRVRRAGVATVELSLTERERLFLLHHPHRRLKVRVSLVFRPVRGGRLSTSIAVLMA